MVLERGYNIVFLVAGKGSDEYTKTMHSIVDELGLSTHVKFTGFIDNMSDFLANVDLVVHTSGKESFGRVYVESMAAGKPILAIKGTAEEEIIGTDEGGFTYSVNELHLMADKICELADNREESRRIGRKGKERAEKLYSISAHVQKIYVTYSLLINRNKIM